MAEQQILGFPTKAAPNDRLTKDSETFELLAVRATFDGTAAGSSFVPAVVIVSDAGEEVGTFPLGGSVAAGDTVAVTFAPFLRNDTGRAGIFFDTYPQVGRFLRIETTGPDVSGYGIQLLDDGNAIHITSDDGAGGGEIFLASPFIRADTAGASFRLLDTGETFFTGTDASWAFSSSWTMITPDFEVGLDTVSGKLVVTDRSGNKLFQIDQDGSLHGKTGKTLTFDL